MEEFNNFVAGPNASFLLWIAIVIAVAFVLFLIFDTIRRRSRNRSPLPGSSHRRNPFRRLLGAYRDIRQEIKRKEQRKSHRRNRP